MIDNLQVNNEKLTLYLSELIPEKLRLNEIISCRRCGWCCINTTPSLLVEEVDLMSLSLNISKQEFIEDYTNKKLFEDKKEYALKSPCPFLKKKGDKYSCKIYPFRPFICRFFPFGGMLVVVDPCQKGKDIYDILWKWYEDHKEDKEIFNYENRLLNIDKDINNQKQASQSEIILFTEKDDYNQIIKFVKKRMRYDKN